MAKISKEEAARREGMSYALRVAKKDGVDALEQEIRWRDAYNIPVKISRADMEGFSNNVKEQCFHAVLVMSLLVMRDEFGFGRKRLEKYMDHFWRETDALSGDYCSWQDYLDILKNECGMELQVSDSNDRNYRLKGEKNEKDA